MLVHSSNAYNARHAGVRNPTRFSFTCYLPQCALTGSQNLGPSLLTTKNLHLQQHWSQKPVWALNPSPLNGNLVSSCSSLHVLPAVLPWVPLMDF